jgi:hypothetical protein
MLPAHATFAGEKVQGYTISASHAASTTVTLAVSGQWRLRMLRPAGGLVVIGFTALDRDEYSFSAAAFPNGETICAWFEGNGGGGSGSSVSKPLPRWVETAPVRLLAGRYKVTVVTKRPTKMQLLPSAHRAVMRSLAATGATDAGVATRSVRDPSQSDVAHESVDFPVPADARQVLLVARTRWAGDDTVDYDDLCYSAGVAHDVPCAGDPTYAATQAVNPGAPDGEWSQFEMLIQRADVTGPGTASFYFAVHGTVSHRGLVAIALP